MAVCRAAAHPELLAQSGDCARRMDTVLGENEREHVNSDEENSSSENTEAAA